MFSPASRSIPSAVFDLFIGASRNLMHQTSFFVELADFSFDESFDDRAYFSLLAPPALGKSLAPSQDPSRDFVFREVAWIRAACDGDVVTSD